MVKEIILNNLHPIPEYVFGFADLHGLLDSKFDGFPYGISIGKKLDDRIIDDLKDGPTIEYYDHYCQVNKDLTEMTVKIQDDLNRVGVESMILPPTISFKAKGYEKYLEKLTYDLSHKMVATRAGLGWIGKTDLFISETFGPRLRLVSILLKQDPGVDSVPVDESKCGKCNICVVRCPAKAANGKLWNSGIHRDEFFDAYKCREKCGELAKQRLGVEERICGLCVCVCPLGNSCPSALTGKNHAIG
jgi:epoxyqueuosine reductase QueG